MTENNAKSQFVTSTAGAKKSYLALSMDEMVNPSADNRRALVAEASADPRNAAVVQSYAQSRGFDVATASAARAASKPGSSF